MPTPLPVSHGGNGEAADPCHLPGVVIALDANAAAIAAAESEVENVAPHSQGSDHATTAPQPPVGIAEAASSASTVGKVARPQTYASDRGVAQASGWVSEVPRQAWALLRKNALLARRNWASTSMRCFSSLFFLLMIFLVDHGLQARYAMTPYFQDLPDTISLRREIPGIPKCRQTKSHPSCITFAYVPAPKDEYVPATTYPSVDAFARAMASTVDAGGALCRYKGMGVCDEDACRQATFDAAHQCFQCCELHRVDRVVGTIMAKNGSRVGSGSSFPIAAENVLGFKSETALDAFLLRSPGLIQGAYIFSSPDRNRTTFLVQHNSTPTQARRVWRDPVMLVTTPMQVTASKAIMEEIFAANLAGNPAKNASGGLFERILVSLQPFAHPASANIPSFESQVASPYAFMHSRMHAHSRRSRSRPRIPSPRHSWIALHSSDGKHGHETAATRWSRTKVAIRSSYSFVRPLIAAIEICRDSNRERDSYSFYVKIAVCATCGSSY